MPARTVLVTGANRGIGFAIVQALATRSPQDVLLLGCRSPERGEEAVAKLRGAGVAAALHVVALDIDSDASIAAAAQHVEAEFGRLDVLVNNAGVAHVAASLADMRAAYDATLATNVTSVAVTTAHFLPLLRRAGGAKVVMVSSARGSAGRAAAGKLPPTVSVAYGASKAALNMLAVEMGRAPDNHGVAFAACSPGHCRTEFNGFRGTKDPLDGARVVVALVNDGDGRYAGGFWEMEGRAEPTAVEW